MLSVQSCTKVSGKMMYIIAVKMQIVDAIKGRRGSVF